MSIWFSWRRVLLWGLFAVLAVVLVPAGTAQAADPQWFAQYFNNVNLSGAPVLERFENDINNEWGERFSPAPGVNKDEFSVRWTRRIHFPTTGTYRFSATMDDGMRVFVNDTLVINGWNTGTRRTLATNVDLTAGDHLVRVEFFDQLLGATAIFTWDFVSAGPPIQNWRGEYFNNRNLAGAPVLVRDDGNIDFNWGLGSPSWQVNADNFSVRWTRTLNLSPGTYRFTTTTDDGVRLWIDGQLLIDRWFPQTQTTYTADVISVGEPLPVRMEYFEAGNVAIARLSWVPLSVTPPPTSGERTATAISARANIRQGPSTSYPILDTVTQGTILALGEHRTADNYWVQVFLEDGTQGWTYASLWNLSVPITTLPVWADAEFPAGPFATLIGASHLNVRSGPGAAFSTVAVLNRDEFVELHGRDASGQWLYIRLRDGRYGWASAAYLLTSVPVNSLPIIN